MREESNGELTTRVNTSVSIKKEVREQSKKRENINILKEEEEKDSTDV